MNIKITKKDIMTSAILVLIGFIISVLFYSYILFTGQTFGQRCAEHYEKGTTEYKECVIHLSEGRTHDGFSKDPRCP